MHEAAAKIGRPWDDAEDPQHASAIEVLSRDLGAPREDVEKLYREVCAELGDGAQIRDYIAILVSRQVRGMWRRKAH